MACGINSVILITTIIIVLRWSEFGTCVDCNCEDSRTSLVLVIKSSLCSPRLEEEWEHKNRERVLKSALTANRLVQEANMLADELHKDTLFRVTLTVPKSFLSPRQRMDLEEMSTSNEVAIRVLHKQRGTNSIWSLETLEEKLPTMREMYERVEEGRPPLVSQISVSLTSLVLSNTVGSRLSEQHVTKGCSDN